MLRQDKDLDESNLAQNEELLGDSPLKSTETSPSKRLAWCSQYKNNISIIDLEKREERTNFTGVQLIKADEMNISWPLLKEISNQGLLVSLHSSMYTSANMQIFDVSQKSKARKIYSFEEVHGVTGFGDVTFNSRRNILGALSVAREIAYHLFKIEYVSSKSKYSVKLLRKSRWQWEYTDKLTYNNWITGFDFDPSGESAATIDFCGIFLISDLNSHKNKLRLNLESKKDSHARCRWSTNIGEPVLFAKYDSSRLNFIDIELKVEILKNPIQLEERMHWVTFWIDACPNDGNLLASSGQSNTIVICGRREAKIVRSFSKLHSVNAFGSIQGRIHCVRWNSTGDMLASVADDGTAKIIDFKTGKVIQTESNSDNRMIMISSWPH